MALTLKGIKLFPKKDNQPDFVIAAGVITLDDLQAFWIDNKEHLSQYNGKEQMRVQLLKGKDSGLYFTVDTWKPSAEPKLPAAPEDPNQNADLEKLPF